MKLARRIKDAKGWEDGIYTLRGLLIPDMKEKASKAELEGAFVFDCTSGDVLILEPYEAKMIAEAVKS